MAKRSTTTVAKHDSFGTPYRRFLVDQVDGKRRIHLLLLVDKTGQTVVVRFPFLRNKITMNTTRRNTNRKGPPVGQCHWWRAWRKNSLGRYAWPLLSVPTSVWTHNGRLAWSVPRPTSDQTSSSTPFSTSRSFCGPSRFKGTDNYNFISNTSCFASTLRDSRDSEKHMEW